jgi:hypothetical protein
MPWGEIIILVISGIIFLSLWIVAIVKVGADKEEEFRNGRK